MKLALIDGAWTLDGAAYEARDEALSASVAGVPEKARVMPGSSWVWIPASSPEPTGPVTAEAVQAMADELNASTHPRPIDGGSEDSPTHAYAERGDVPANGWAHRAAVAEVNGAPMVFFQCEVVSNVAPLLSSGRLAFSSIHARFPLKEDGEADSARAELVSLGLTNHPANTDLPPITVVRGGRTFAHVVTRAMSAGVCRMADKKEAPPAAKEPAVEVKKAAPTPEEMVAMIEELTARIATLEGEKEAMSSENKALEAARSAATAEIAELRSSMPADDAEAKAVAAVETALREGRFASSRKASYLVVARASLPLFEKQMAELPPLGQRVVLRSEAKPAESQKSIADEALESAAKHYPEGPAREAFITRSKARFASKGA